MDCTDPAHVHVSTVGIWLWKRRYSQLPQIADSSELWVKQLDIIERKGGGGRRSPPGHSFCDMTLLGGKPFNLFPSQPGHRFVCYIHCRWVSLRSAFPPWTGHQSCCMITTSFSMRKSSWTASVYLRGSSRLLPAFLPVLMRLRQILIFNPLYNILHGWSEYLTWIICWDYQREIPR